MLEVAQPSQTEYVLLWIKYPLTTNSFWFQSTQQYIILFYGGDMFWSLDQHQGISTNLILTFCKDGLMVVKWSKHVVQIKYI